MAERTEFVGAQGDSLAARIDRPNGSLRAWALFAHCFSCSKDVHAANRVSAGLAERGIGVMRFDFTGLGASGGDFANTNFSSNVEDLVRAAEHLERRFGAPELLIGHSLGGAACLVAATRISGARAVVTLAAPSDAEHVKHAFIEHVPEIEARGEAEVRLAGRPFRIKRQFLDDISNHNVVEAVRNLKRPLLVAHSPTDELVGVEHATNIFVAAKHPKSFLSLDGSDHLLTNSDDADYAAGVIAAWADRYLGVAPVRHSATDGVVVSEAGAGRYANTVNVRGKHIMCTDEPESVGGGDAGPTPYEYLNASLGACTSMTLRMYADRKDLPLDKVEVSVRHEKIHAKDCADCDQSDAARVDRFERQIRLFGDLSADQRAKLLEIADKCPVHRTLHGQVEIRTELVEKQDEA